MATQTTLRPTRTPVQTPPSRQDAPTVAERIAAAQAQFGRWLNAHSIDVLRVSLGLVFLGFGLLKFIPGASPAEELATRTVVALSGGILSDQVAIVVTAVAECLIAVTMISGRFLKAGLVVLAGSLVGIMSPMVLFFSELFPDGAPTLEAQYIFKDIVLAAAGLVIAAKALGGRLTTDDNAHHHATAS